MKANATTITPTAGRSNGRSAISAVQHIAMARAHLEAALESVPVGNAVDLAVRVDIGAMIRALASASKDADGAFRGQLLGLFVPTNVDGEYRPLVGTHYRAELTVFRVGRIDTKRLRETEPKVAARYMTESVERRLSFRPR